MYCIKKTNLQGFLVGLKDIKNILIDSLKDHSSFSLNEEIKRLR
jgi:hypothetical protein